MGWWIGVVLFWRTYGGAKSHEEIGLGDWCCVIGLGLDLGPSLQGVRECVLVGLWE